MRPFAIFCTVGFGQIISLLGSAVTGFALGVWVYQKTGVVTDYTLIAVCNILPGIVVSPFVGVFIDRWTKKRCLLIGDIGAALPTVVLAFLFFMGDLKLLHIYLIVSFSSVFNAFQIPSFNSLITMLVDEDRLRRAVGLSQAGWGMGLLLAPFLGASLLQSIGMKGILLLDGGTFIFSSLVLLAIRIPEKRIQKEESLSQDFWEDLKSGFRFVRQHKVLRLLLTGSALNDYSVTLVQILSTPIILLTYGSVSSLGTVMTLGGVGMMVGSVIMGIWGGPAKGFFGVYFFQIVTGLAIFSTGFRPPIHVLGFAIFFIMFGVPLAKGCNQVFWLKLVPLQIQGRVFSTKQMIERGALALAYLSAGPLADYVFEPLFAEKSELVQLLLGRYMKVGPGVGMAVLFILLGIVIIVVSAIFYFMLKSTKGSVKNKL